MKTRPRETWVPPVLRLALCRTVAACIRVGSGCVDQGACGLRVDEGVVVQEPNELITALSRGAHANVASTCETEVATHLQEMNVRESRSDSLTGFVAGAIVNNNHIKPSLILDRLERSDAFERISPPAV